MGPLAPGSLLGGYTIEKILGQGGMGAVYAARDQKGRAVALKVLTPDHARDKTFIERFRREALAAATLVHPNVARCLGAGEQGGTHFLALELVAGGSLDDRLKKTGKIGWREAARLGAGIARALAAIHEAGMIHRDLKPGNVLVGADGVVKVTDFGIARRSGTGSLTKTGEFLGTPDFMAPEQAMAVKKVDGQADLYSLGALLHALVTGSPPFTGSSFSILQKHATAAPPRLRSLVPEASADLDALVFKLLAKEPADRGTVIETAEQLELLGEGGKVAKAPGRGPLVAVFAVVAALVVVGVGLAVAAALGPRRGTGPGPGPTVAPTATPGPVVSATPPAPRLPGWFLALPESERPPLPGAVVPSEIKGEYVAAKDKTIVLVHVPPGVFEMGDPLASGGEAPHHEVELSGYFIGRTEVTNAQFRRFVSGRKAPLVIPPGRDRNHVPDNVTLDWEHPFTKPYKFDEQHPVVEVTFAVAHEHARSLGLDLPTEAQWERAAAWDPETKTSRRFAWGDAVPSTATPALGNLIDVSLHALYPGPNPVFPGYFDGFALVSPVGHFKKDRSPAGILDATGNVRELCRDFYDERFYERSPRVDPVNEEANRMDLHSVRGGSWGLHTASVGVQERSKINHPSNCIGYRFAVR